MTDKKNSKCTKKKGNSRRSFSCLFSGFCIGFGTAYIIDTVLKAIAMSL